MLRKWLSYLLVVLISIQSVVAIADAHQSHQKGKPHVDFNHDHDSSTIIKIQRDETGAVQYDCHHCCHGHSCFSVTAINNSFPGKASKDHIPYHHFIYSSNQTSPDIRPPIV
ncbi:MAG: hypothetical protein JKY67_19385 [Pseudomonadales bacterium]|nr:hypothetical protein [Pseudomonadales bacterium]